MGDVMNGTRFVGEAGGRDSGRVGELAAIIGGDGTKDGGEAFGTESSFDAVEDMHDVLTGFTAHKVDKLEASDAFSKDGESCVRTGGTDNTVHLKMTYLGAFIHLSGALLNTQSTGVEVSKTLMERLSTFFRGP